MAAGYVFDVQPYGGDPDDDVDLFIRKVELSIKHIIMSYDEAEQMLIRCDALQRHLKDDARRFFDDEVSRNDKNDYSILTTRLREFAASRSKHGHSQQVKALRDLGKLKQGSRTIEQYLDEAKRIHKNLDVDSKAYVQEVLVDNLNDENLQEKISNLLSILDNPPTFEKFCRIVLTAATKRWKPDMADDEQTTRVTLPTREEENQLRMFELVRQEKSAETNVLATLADAIARLQIDQPNRSTYKKSNVLDPVQNNARSGQTMDAKPSAVRNAVNPNAVTGSSVTTTEAVCYKCWEPGHVQGMCSAGQLPLAEQKTRYASYVADCRRQGKVPADPPYRFNTGIQNRGGMTARQAPVQVTAAIGDEDAELSASSEGDECYLLNAQTRPAIKAEVVVKRLSKPSHKNSKDTLGSAQIMATGEDEPSRNAIRRLVEDEILAAIGGKRSREEMDSDTEDDHERAKLRRTGPKRRDRRQPKPLNHLRMMQGAKELDVVDLIRSKRITEEDGISVGMVLDKSPFLSMQLTKSLVRASEGHKFDKGAPTVSRSNAANQVCMSADLMEQTEIRAQPPPETPDQVDAFVQSLGKIRNFYTTGLVDTSDRLKGSKYSLTDIILDCCSTADYVNNEVAKKLHLERIAIKPRMARLANGGTTTVRAKAYVKLTLGAEEGMPVTRTLVVYLMDGDTPYSMLLGIPGLLFFGATADMSVYPSRYIMKDHKGRVLQLIRDEDKYNSSDGHEKVDAYTGQRAGKPKMSKTVVLADGGISQQLTSSSSACSSSDDATDTEYIDETNSTVARILGELHKLNRGGPKKAVSLVENRSREA